MIFATSLKLVMGGNIGVHARTFEPEGIFRECKFESFLSKVGVSWQNAWQRGSNISHNS